MRYQKLAATVVFSLAVSQISAAQNTRVTLASTAAHTRPGEIARGQLPPEIKSFERSEDGGVVIRCDDGPPRVLNAIAWDEFCRVQYERLIPAQLASTESEGG